MLKDLGFAYQLKGRAGDAVAVLKRGIQKHPNVAKLWNNLGIVMLQSPAFKPAESVEHCRKATQLDSNNPEFRHNLATALRDAEQYADANTEFHKAIVLMKQNTASTAVALADAYHNWALCLQKMGQLETAAEKWQDAVKADPDHKEAMANLIASLLVMQDDYNANKCTHAILCSSQNCLNRCFKLCRYGRSKKEEQ
jgi:Flp pilus assembly protein TadD